MIAQPLLLYLKYYLLYIRRELMYRPIKVRQDIFESNKSSIIISSKLRIDFKMINFQIILL